MKNLFTFLFLFVIFTCPMLSQQNVEEKIHYNIIYENEIIQSDKNPALSFLFSLALPGLGQMYNEEVGTGFLLMGTSLLGYGVYSLSYDDKTAIVGAGIIVISSLYSIIDAPSTSVQINKRNRINRINVLKKYGHLTSYNFQNSTIGLDIDYNKNQGMNVGLTYHF